MKLLILDRTKGWVADDDIDLLIGLKGQGIFLGELPKAACAQFCKPVLIQLIGDDVVRIGSNQQSTIASRGFINGGRPVNPR